MEGYYYSQGNSYSYSNSYYSGSGGGGYGANDDGGGAANAGAADDGGGGATNAGATDDNPGSLNRFTKVALEQAQSNFVGTAIKDVGLKGTVGEILTSGINTALSSSPDWEPLLADCPECALAYVAGSFIYDLLKPSSNSNSYVKSQILANDKLFAGPQPADVIGVSVHYNLTIDLTHTTMDPQAVMDIVNTIIADSVASGNFTLYIREVSQQLNVTFFANATAAHFINKGPIQVRHRCTDLLLIYS